MNTCIITLHLLQLVIIQTMKCHYKLINLPFEFKPFDVDIHSDQKFSKIKEIPLAIHVIRKSNPGLFEWLEKYKLILISCRYFESVMGSTYELHRDTPSKKNKDLLNLINFNFIFDSYGSEMRWYRTNEGYNGYLYMNPFDRQIVGYDIEQCTEIYRAQTDEHCMISAGIIHTLINSEQQKVKRKCYSFTIGNYDWDTAVDHLRDFLE